MYPPARDHLSAARRIAVTVFVLAIKTSSQVHHLTRFHNCHLQASRPAFLAI
jgi:hypothetical protein